MWPSVSDTYPSIDYYCYGGQRQEVHDSGDQQGAHKMSQPDRPAREAGQPASSTSISLAVQRITWFFAGPMTSLLLLFLIVERGNGWWTVPDMLFWIMVAITIGSRWLCYVRGDRRDAYGEVTTPANLRQYTWLACGSAILGWSVANVMGNHWG